MKNLISLLLLISSITVLAQNIKGWVFSEKEKSPVEYATVSLLHLPDSAIVKGVTTQASGMFEFEGIKTGKYYIKASALGLQNKGKNIELKQDISTVKVDTIFMPVASSQIAEVTVTGEKIKGKELVDRTVYSIPSNISKSSVNGYEVLQKIPSIQVDINNNVTLNGSSNFIIQVDGKVRDKEFLAKLLPSDIESVEVINNPSGKYEGTVDGVINIILKKEARYGINGKIEVGIRTYQKFTGYTSGSLDYGLGKLRLYLTGYSWNQNLGVFSTGYYNYGTSISNGSGTGTYKLSANTINTGFDYNFNDKNTLNLNLNFKPYINDIHVNNLGTALAINSVTGLLQDSTILKYPSTNNVTTQEYNLSLFYKKQYQKPIQELTSELRFYRYHSTTDNNLSQFFSPPQKPDSIVYSIPDVEHNIDDRTAYTAKIDYVYPIGISSKIEAGYQLYYQDINYNYSRNSLDTPFHYTEFRNAGYAGLSGNIKKFGLQAMMRAEYSSIDINSTSANSYLCLLPTANLQYKYTGTQNIKLTYNRRIVRPGVGDLYPFLKSSALSFTQGNPYLEPEYDDKFQLTYTANIKKNYISPSIYYTLISNKIGQEIQREDFQPSGFTNVAKSKNILSGYERGIGLNAMFLFFNVNARVYQGHYESYTDSTVKPAVRIAYNNYASFSLNSYMYGQIFWKINGFAFINYNGLSVNAQSRSTSTPFYGFGGQRTFGSHTIKFFYLLPFSKDITMNRTKTSSPGFYSNTSYGFDASYYIQVGYTFQFNKGRTVKKVVHSEESESDIKTQVIGR